MKKDKEETWTVCIAMLFVHDDLLTAARRQLAQHTGKPMLMGRSGPAYESLMLLTEGASRYADAQ